MTKKEILEAAYKVWGRDFYLNTSLSHVARELKVCKPALYRHFLNKDALLKAMIMHFFDDFTAFIQVDFEKAMKTEDKNKSAFILIRSITEYYARNVYLFIFSMTILNDLKLDSFDMPEQLCIRGIDMGSFHSSMKKEYIFEPLVMRLFFATLTFYMANFHKTKDSLSNPPDEAAISKIINVISAIIGQGLGYTSKEIDALKYEELENRIAGTVNDIDGDPLLKAVAGAVAEAGPWQASMEQVARRSGLSKSSLYSHFKNKQDMLHQLFMTESIRIIDFAKRQIKQSEIPQEQLYLGIFSIAEYLRSKPDILVALDWIRNRKLNLNPSGHRHKTPMMGFLRLFEAIDIKPLQNEGSPFREIPMGEKENFNISLWILFLIVKTLMIRKPGRALGDVPNSDIRSLYKFITLGIGGFKQ
ncbi:MAG: TetR/AcrR family transcriptional regulator [Treponema sp.]|jgi:AcrR family transcriptional regulator|nr:TetR/AcrR family transcriptional regulator [Treponema sp.]